jgi:hypothetical protein
MAINLSDNIKVQAPKPADSRYLNITVPYTGTTEVNMLIPSGERFPGLTVLINGTQTGGVNKEYWYKIGVADVDLVLKSLGGTSVLTGATNGLTLVKSGTTAILGGVLTGNTVFDGTVSQYTLRYAGDYSASYTDRSLIDKGYANAILSGLKPKQAVSLATTSNITLSGNQLIDGYMTTTGMRVLVKNQNNSTTGDTANGVYSASTGIWGRTTDFDGTEVESGSYMWVLSGNTNANSSWVLSTPDPIFVGVTSLNFVLFNHVSDVLGGPGITVVQSGGTHTVSVNATNGLTATMAGLALGGTLTGNTVLGGGFNLQYSGSYLPGLSANSLITKQFAESLVATGGTYNLANPATKTVGGVTAGDNLTGKTALCLLQEILAPELFPTSLVNPSVSIGLSPSGTFEVGCSIASLSVTATFSRGSISPQYCSASPFRSGLPNAYSFTGSQMPVGFQACASSPAVETATAYSVLLGGQTWSVCTRYDCGVQPKGSSGTNYNTPLVSGCSNVSNASITGIYPYYYGKLAAGSRPGVTNALITTGCIAKPVADSNGTVTVTFSSSGEWTWLAIPATSTSKTCWFVNALDNGRINNAPSDKYPDECPIAITSAQGCWAGVNYKVYMSGYAATDANPIQFRNS